MSGAFWTESQVAFGTALTDPQATTTKASYKTRLEATLSHLHWLHVWYNDNDTAIPEILSTNPEHFESK